VRGRPRPRLCGLESLALVLEPPSTQVGGSAASTQNSGPSPATSHKEIRSHPFTNTWFWVASVLGIMLLVFASARWYLRIHIPAKWAREVAFPMATRLVDAGNAPDAFPIIHEALRTLPGDPTLNRLLRVISHPLRIRTTPPGANVKLKPYGQPERRWISIGPSPIDDFLVPLRPTGESPSSGSNLELRAPVRTRGRIRTNGFGATGLPPRHCDPFSVQAYGLAEGLLTESSPPASAHRRRSPTGYRESSGRREMRSVRDQCWRCCEPQR
jgi:hypothetical protein